MKVFETTPRYGCIRHEREIARDTGAKFRQLSAYPGPWIEPAIVTDGTGKPIKRDA